MIRGGKGGAKTQSGLKFESRVDLRSVFEKMNGYSTDDNDLLFKGKKVAQLFKKHDLYKGFYQSIILIGRKRFQNSYCLTKRSLFWQIIHYSLLR